MNIICVCIAVGAMMCAFCAQYIDESKEGAYLFLCTAFLCICLGTLS